MADKELASYSDLDGEINKAIAETRAEIDGLKVQLSEERIVRRHKEEYEEFAKVVNKHNLRSELVTKTNEAAGKICVSRRHMRTIETHFFFPSVTFLSLIVFVDEIKAMKTKYVQLEATIQTRNLQVKSRDPSIVQYRFLLCRFCLP